jgi:hypothetical protein
MSNPSVDTAGTGCAIVLGTLGLLGIGLFLAYLTFALLVDLLMG